MADGYTSKEFQTVREALLARITLIVRTSGAGYCAGLTTTAASIGMRKHCPRKAVDTQMNEIGVQLSDVADRARKR
jgi:hypothetical protein